MTGEFAEELATTIMNEDESGKMTGRRARERGTEIVAELVAARADAHARQASEALAEAQLADPSRRR